MGQRSSPLITGEYYHVFNKSINKEPIFTSKKVNQRTVTAIFYYKHNNPPVKLSHLYKIGVDRRNEIFNNLEKLEKLVTIITYNLMPNHYHLILKQEKDGGISKYISLLQNSMTKYYNIKNTREGHLFKGQFKSVHIEDDDQLLHTHRYIHLNQYSSKNVAAIDDLINYPFSSLPEYLENTKGMCNKEIILNNFKSLESYKKFIFDQADYERNLEGIKHLKLE